jgi:hypothetical protein
MSINKTAMSIKYHPFSPWNKKMCFAYARYLLQQKDMRRIYRRDREDL